ncbi:hypothetical protein [Mycolicibacterium gilvum]|uniref:Conserved alanine and proline rich protein n=1 Tax=Mycolicibacterium gilvum TaxID=1804 RepID=A0A378SH82_9MYCO|nr:hypothetical protein [Mycolicibacterium gilvum]STZ42060.1 conserved alanine and proline rich protein [Mycolicibacterium gilvum]
MPDDLDVGARLAQGRPAADTLQRYVAACRQLGYEHRDLTLHPAQVTDWYGTEDGMDLAALHRCCVALDAVGRAAQEALAVQERQLGELSAAWEGAGGDAARIFLARHGDSSAVATAAVRTAAEALVSLREELWRVVGGKVDSTVSAEGRAAGAQAQWSAAATSVTTGAGDTATAGEIVEQSVKPFVDSVIRDQWLPAMRDTVAAVTAAYDGAIAEIGAQRTPTFDVPGDLGPSCPEPHRICDDEGQSGRAAVAASPPAAATSAAWSPPAGTPAATAPSAWSPPAAPAPVPPAPAAPSPLAPAPLAAPAPEAPLPSPGSLGSGMPGLGGGPSGFGQHFADALSGLLGGGLGGDALESPDLDLEEPALDEPGVEEPELEEEENEEDAELEEDDEAEEKPESVVAADPVLPEEPCDPPPEPAATVAAPEPPAPPPPAEPVPAAEPASDEQTPCEIAAGEVPQVGESAG